MREVVLDTETTGFNPDEGHRLVEIGCLELINHVATGKTFHIYINPERDMPEDARAVHGLTEEFLKKHPIFKDQVTGLLDFIQDDPLVIHNAAFDMRFLNAELQRAGFASLTNKIVDTLMMARQKFPGSPASLDALCKRFGVDNSGRIFHGALLDSELLAEIYLELIGGRQPGLGLMANQAAQISQVDITREYREPRPHEATAEELSAHEELLKLIKKPLWGTA